MICHKGGCHTYRENKVHWRTGLPFRCIRAINRSKQGGLIATADKDHSCRKSYPSSLQPPIKLSMLRIISFNHIAVIHTVYEFACAAGKEVCFGRLRLGISHPAMVSWVSDQDEGRNRTFHWSVERYLSRSLSPML